MKTTQDIPKAILISVYIEIGIRMILVVIAASIAGIFSKMSGRLLMLTDALMWEHDTGEPNITKLIGKEMIAERKRKSYGRNT